MDLSFINVPTSQDELLGLLHVAYKAGQNSVEPKTFVNQKTHNGIPAVISYTKSKSSFKQWLTRLAHQWEDLKHS